jgi:hypothetical protein
MTSTVLIGSVDNLDERHASGAFVFDGLVATNCRGRISLPQTYRGAFSMSSWGSLVDVQMPIDSGNIQYGEQEDHLEMH